MCSSQCVTVKRRIGWIDSEHTGAYIPFKGCLDWANQEEVQKRGKMKRRGCSAFQTQTHTDFGWRKSGQLNQRGTGRLKVKAGNIISSRKEQQQLFLSFTFATGSIRDTLSGGQCRCWWCTSKCTRETAFFWLTDRQTNWLLRMMLSCLNKTDKRLENRDSNSHQENSFRCKLNGKVVINSTVETGPKWKWKNVIGRLNMMMMSSEHYCHPPQSRRHHFSGTTTGNS